MNKKTRKIGLVITSILMIVTMAFSVFANRSLGAISGIINSKDETGIIWDGNTLSLGSSSWEAISNSEEGEKVTFIPKGGKSTTKNFTYENAADIERKFQQFANNIEGEQNDTTVKGIAGKVKNSIAGTAQTMQFDVDVSKGFNILGGGVIGLFTWILNLLIAIIWLFFLLSTVCDFGAIAGGGIREFLLQTQVQKDDNGKVVGGGELAQSKKELKGWRRWLISSQAIKAINKEETGGENALFAYLKTMWIQCVAVLIATFAIPSGGIFTLTEAIMSLLPVG